MATQVPTNLFKNLPRLAGGAPREGEPPTEEPTELPLGEYDKPPQVIEETPAPPEPPSESGAPPPEESPPEVEIEPEPEEEIPVEGEEEIQAADAAGKPNELDMLKQRALLMGIKFSNNISSATLRTKIQARLDGEEAKEAAEAILSKQPRKEAEEAAMAVRSDRQTLFDTEMRLVRLRITNLDPKKKDLPGEIFTVANEVLGAVKKYIPYGEATENGYHVPYIIYRQLKEREFLNIKTRKDRQGRTIVETGMVREFALEELPPLTQQELNRLAASQAAAAGM
jgi:hypothetical protein